MYFIVHFHSIFSVSFGKSVGKCYGTKGISNKLTKPPNNIAKAISKAVMNIVFLYPNSLTRDAIVAIHGIYSIVTTA